MLVVMVDVWVAAGSSIVQGFNLACREVLAEVSIQITRLSAEVLHRTDGVVASQLLSNTVKLVVESLCKLSVNAYQFRTQRLVRFFAEVCMVSRGTEDHGSQKNTRQEGPHFDSFETRLV